MYLCFSTSMFRLKSRIPKTNERLSSALHLQIIVLLTTLCLLYTPGEGNQTHRQKVPHRCFVCLPQDKQSMLSKEIIDSFPGKPVPDCASFPNSTEEQTNAQEFQFNCPKSYSAGGCLLRMSGFEISRTCSPFKLNDCKMVNSIELCYCSDSLCNNDKVSMQTRPVLVQETPRISRHFHEGETDDEDLLRTGDHHHSSHYHDDEHEETGSGQFAPEDPQEPDNLNPLNTNNISSFIPSQPESEESDEEDDTQDRARMDEDDLSDTHTFQTNQSQESNETIRTSQIIPAEEAIGAANSYKYFSPPSLVPLSTLCLLVIWRNL